MKVAPDAVSDAPRSAGPLPLGRLGLVVTLGAALVVVLDFSIVNVALPALSGEMGVSTVTAGWVVTAYALTFGGLLVIGGRASDFFGRPRLLVAGLVVFAVASAAGSVAVDFPLLVAARAIQGAAAALIAPAALSTLTTSFPEGPARERVIGYYGMTASLGFVVGLVAGGALVDTVGWRGVFFVNVPVCLVLAALGPKVLPGWTPVRGDRRLDLTGALLVTAGMAVLVYAPTVGTNEGWGSVAFGACLLVSLALLVAFPQVERRSLQPVVPLSIFRHHTLVVGVAVVGSVVALGARTPASSTGSAAGYRLVLVCWAGVAVAAALVSLALPARRPTVREPASAPSRPRHAYPPARSTA